MGIDHAIETLTELEIAEIRRRLDDLCEEQRLLRFLLLAKRMVRNAERGGRIRDAEESTNK